MIIQYHTKPFCQDFLYPLKHKNNKLDKYHKSSLTKYCTFLKLSRQIIHFSMHKTTLLKDTTNSLAASISNNYSIFIKYPVKIYNSIQIPQFCILSGTKGIKVDYIINGIAILQNSCITYFYIQSIFSSIVILYKFSKYAVSLNWPQNMEIQHDVDHLRIFSRDVIFKECMQFNVSLIVTCQIINPGQTLHQEALRLSH